MADPKSLADLFVQKLRYVYDAEQRLIDALPKLAEAADASELKGAFEAHLRETEAHVERLIRVFGMFNEEADSEKNNAIKGIVSAGDDVMDLDSDAPAVKDAALIAAAQAAEHYEIAEYGTLRTWAGVLSKPEAVELLNWTLQEEKKADQLLTEIAARLNFEAALPRAR